jgi:hypothetical protein
MAVGFFGKQLFKTLLKGGKQKTTGKEVVNPFKANVNKSKKMQVVDRMKIDTLKTKGKMKRSFQKMEEDIDPSRIKLRQTTQKIADEPITKSGFSKGKNIKKKEKK